MNKCKNINNWRAITIFLLLGLGTVISQCATKTGKKAVLEDFDQFHRQFFRDSAFQVERIRFPLPGHNTEAKKMPGDSLYYWQKNEWQRLYPFSRQNSGLNRQMTVTDSLAIEKIYLDHSGFFVKLRYQPFQGRWHLTYFVNSNL